MWWGQQDGSGTWDARKDGGRRVPCHVYISEGKDTGLLREYYTASEGTHRVTLWLTLPCTAQHRRKNTQKQTNPLETCSTFNSLFTKQSINFRKQSVRSVVTAFEMLEENWVDHESEGTI